MHFNTEIIGSGNRSMSKVTYTRVVYGTRDKMRDRGFDVVLHFLFFFFLFTRDAGGSRYFSFSRHPVSRKKFVFVDIIVKISVTILFGFIARDNKK